MLGILNPCGGGDPIPLTQTKLLVGRRSHCDICLNLKTVSGQHCELEFKGGYWHIRDLGSSNGVKVNGLEVDSKCLVPGDEVMIAKESFTIEYEVSTDAGPPEEDDPFAIPLMEKAGLQTRREQRMPQASGASRSGSNRSGSRSVRRNSSPRDDFLMRWLNDDEH